MYEIGFKNRLGNGGFYDQREWASTYFSLLLVLRQKTRSRFGRETALKGGSQQRAQDCAERTARHSKSTQVLLHSSLKLQDCSWELREEEDLATPTFKILRYRSLDRCQRAVPTSKEPVQVISILNPLATSRIGTLSSYLSPPRCSRRHRGPRLIMLPNAMLTGRRRAKGTVTQHDH